MKKLTFLVNVDKFFDSHRRPLQLLLSNNYPTRVVAGDTGFKVSYQIDKFSVRSRIPTLRGLVEMQRIIRQEDTRSPIIVVTPMMIVLSHFLFFDRKIMYYNWSGLGFIRHSSPLRRAVLFTLMKIFPTRGQRVMIVQNTDDKETISKAFLPSSRFSVELIAGSGVNEQPTYCPGFESITIGYVGRIRKDKGVLDLVRAVSSLNQAQIQLGLVIWGELDDPRHHGFSETELAELESHSVFFKGFTNDKDKIYHSFNIFCLPSNGEGLSRAAIEASSYGLPLLLSKVPGNRDMIAGNGLFFEYGESADLLRCIESLLRMPPSRLQEMSMKGRELYDNRWTLNAVHRQWLNLLERFESNS